MSLFLCVNDLLLSISKSHFVFGVETGDGAVDKEDLISDNGMTHLHTTCLLKWLR